tara:strand:- start:912 stop:1757 length:846 start_codon:yes stop_codon:yes gene_type:complete
MRLSYKKLRDRYLNLFDDDNKCDFVLTDVLFAFNEIYPLINSNKVNKILEVGCGTGILLKELSDLFPDKKFVGIDPHESGFHNYENLSKKINNDSSNIIINHQNLDKINLNDKFDLIFSFNVFEHIKDQNQYLINTQNYLSDFGKNLVLCPNYDFPYEPHFFIPIIFNKKITFFIFKNKINQHEILTGEKGLWEGLNLNGKKKIEKFLKQNNFLFKYDESIKDRFFDRIENDPSKYFRKRQGFVSKLALIGKKFYLDKIMFNFFKVPFPYLKLIIQKEIKQ